MRGFKHLTELCDEFQVWYNYWRPHMTLEGLRPNDFFYDNKPAKPERDAKQLPINIEQHYFSQTRSIGYRLKKAALFYLTWLWLHLVNTAPVCANFKFRCRVYINRHKIGHLWSRNQIQCSQIYTLIQISKSKPKNQAAKNGSKLAGQIQLFWIFSCTINSLKLNKFSTLTNPNVYSFLITKE
ncbi:MAG: hypothetical protein JEZ07_17990 [Phycisphaerae bacterium]|nr:hypothetical protein [Phycisphaerae bacterium]